MAKKSVAIVTPPQGSTFGTRVWLDKKAAREFVKSKNNHHESDPANYWRIHYALLVE